MKVFIGTDIEDCGRFENLYKNRRPLLKRMFSEEEYNFCINRKNTIESFTATWCAKEAVVKACCELIDLSIRDVNISRQSNGAPSCKISLDIDLNIDISLSISHTPNYSIATALVLHKD